MLLFLARLMTKTRALGTFPKPDYFRFACGCTLAACRYELEKLFLLKHLADCSVPILMPGRMVGLMLKRVKCQNDPLDRLTSQV